MTSCHFLSTLMVAGRVFKASPRPTHPPHLPQAPGPAQLPSQSGLRQTAPPGQSSAFWQTSSQPGRALQPYFQQESSEVFILKDTETPA